MVDAVAGSGIGVKNLADNLEWAANLPTVTDAADDAWLPILYFGEGSPTLTTPYTNFTITLQDILAFDVTSVWSGATSYTINGMTYALEDVNSVITGAVVDSGTRNFNIEAHNEYGTNTDSFFLQVLSGIPNKVRG
jgi:hypothetical protein